MSSWDGPPSDSPWLRTGKRSRVSHSKVKAEIHVPQAERGPSQKARAALGETHSIDRVWAVSEGESGPGRYTLHRLRVGRLRR